MRLTAELIQGSLSYINPLTERELDLRGHKIPAIENLGVAREQDCIDFTDNDIAALSNFPLSPRLHTLLLARNRIAHIQPTLARSLPNLSTLVLTHNQISELSDLEPLSGLAKLTHVVLMENPVAQKENYRLYVLYLNPHIRFLDYRKVRDAERAQSRALFGTTDAPTELAQKISGIKSKTFDVPSGLGVANGVGGEKAIALRLSDKEKKKVEELIRNAKSLSEISRLEKALNEGRLPPGIVVD
ncbi:small nuclear ribonucleoprotein U2, A [Pseudovirgaria hyperparasitica]|uniref:U2 small nuclear ribonucleoprotein A' n=1 Tax=Pseudovirgaria hyperparasitica TaxID=470096 RepID=A0A6A6VTS9_9PEZI|nr:small nuclear ribonucleoprotein U2, A [Pseudovirgaria hyperparasitica]KAF2753010.1 small nuclear ribonucleoprotein U2, A [Pseudovirgaria hyperparasitica]